ncbi:MAG: hypothetical protein ACJ70X_10300 [Nitrososphaera sp.]
MPEVEQQLLVWMVTGQVVDCDGLSIVLSLDPESLLDSQLWADCQGKSDGMLLYRYESTI